MSPLPATGCGCAISPERKTLSPASLRCQRWLSSCRQECSFGAKCLFLCFSPHPSPLPIFLPVEMQWQGPRGVMDAGWEEEEEEEEEADEGDPDLPHLHANVPWVSQGSHAEELPQIFTLVMGAGSMGWGCPVCLWGHPAISGAMHRTPPSWPYPCTTTKRASNCPSVRPSHFASPTCGWGRALGRSITAQASLRRRGKGSSPLSKDPSCPALLASPRDELGKPSDPPPKLAPLGGTPVLHQPSLSPPSPSLLSLGDLQWCWTSAVRVDEPLGWAGVGGGKEGGEAPRFWEEAQGCGVMHGAGGHRGSPCRMHMAKGCGSSLCHGHRSVGEDNAEVLPKKAAGC